MQSNLGFYDWGSTGLFLPVAHKAVEFWKGTIEASLLKYCLAQSALQRLRFQPFWLQSTVVSQPVSLQGVPLVTERSGPRSWMHQDRQATKGKEWKLQSLTY